MPEYEIYALCSAGPFKRKKAMVLWMSDWEASLEICYFLWLVKGPEGLVLVDAGVNPELAAQRELPGYVSPLELLSRLGIGADDIRQVVLTHLHWDHVCGVNLFPKATFFVQKIEFDFWTKDPVARKGPFGKVSLQEPLDYLASLQGGPRLVLLDGDSRIGPGLECLLAPGHSPGLQALAVSTAKGRAVLGSDCAHVFQNYTDAWPSSIICDMPAWLRSFDKLKAAVSSPELLFPGHDEKMRSAYPQVCPGLTRLV